MQLVCPDMIDAGGGSIINITSVASRIPGDGPYPDRSGGVLPGYGGSKAALEHLTQCAAFDLAGHNIAVNALSPSKPILTPGLAYYAREFADTAAATSSQRRREFDAGGCGCGDRAHDRPQRGSRRQLPAVLAGLVRDHAGSAKISMQQRYRSLTA